VIGDGAAPEKAQRRNRYIVVWRVGIGGWRYVTRRVRKADDGHHRDRRHPGLFAVLGRIVEREKRGPVLATAIGVAVDLEPTAVRCETGKVGVAGAAGLAGLPGKTRQSAGRRRKLDHEKSSKEQGRCAKERQTKLSDPWSSSAHCTTPPPLPIGIGTAGNTGARSG